MKFNDIFKSNFLENVTVVSPLDMALTIVLAFGIGLFIFYVYSEPPICVISSSIIFPRFLAVPESIWRICLKTGKAGNRQTGKAWIAIFQ